MKPGPKQRRAQETYERLLDVAGALLGEVGIERVSTNLIAARAGVTPPALYRYFNLDISRPHIPNVQAWYERLMARTPYRQHVMIPFDDLRGRLAY